MIPRVRHSASAMGRIFTERGISQKTLGRVSLLLVIGMLAPLLLIALCNYPADDDFASALPVATAWLNTGSLSETVKAIYEKTMEHYQNWNGYFVSAILCTLSPMIFSIDFYFLSNWAVLGLLCLSVAYLLKAAMAALGCRAKSVFWILYAAVLILALQFMPSIGDGVYWHTGSMYTVVACTLFFTLGLLLRCSMPQSKGRAIWRGALLALCGLSMGGSFYGPMLGAFTALLLLTLQSFVRRKPSRIYLFITLVGFAFSLMLSILSPGNQLRQDVFGEPMGVVPALLTSVLDSFDLVGAWLSPQLFAMLLLILPVLWHPLKESPFSFQHPLSFFILWYGMFSATLMPGIYTGASYGMSRYMNIIYFYFLLMALASSAYTLGWFIRWLEQRQNSEKARQLLALSAGLGQRFTALYLAVVLVLLAMGGFAFTIMNTSSVSAAKSLLSGEAARFHRDMQERQEYIRVTDSDVVAVKVLDSQPFVFKPDKLPFQGIYGRVRYMKWYFELFHNANLPQP